MLSSKSWEIRNPGWRRDSMRHKPAATFTAPWNRENQLAHGLRLRSQSAEAGATPGLQEFPELPALRVPTRRVPALEGQDP